MRLKPGLMTEGVVGVFLVSRHNLFPLASPFLVRPGHSSRTAELFLDENRAR